MRKLLNLLHLPAVLSTGVYCLAITASVKYAGQCGIKPQHLLFFNRNPTHDPESNFDGFQRPDHFILHYQNYLSMHLRVRGSKSFWAIY